MEPTRSLARCLWEAIEPVHAVAYFAPGPAEAARRVGLRGFWMSYFASRVAPLGPVPATAVTAMAYGFAPAMVARAIPDAWRFADPAAVLAARIASAAAVLREHRGDGHVLAAVCAGLGGLDATVTFVATGAITREIIQPPAPWAAAGGPGPGDRTALVAMLARCTTATRYGRFHIAAHADHESLRPLRARVLVHQGWIVALLRRYGTCESVLSHGGYNVALPRGPGAGGAGC